jgi:serine/threonine protein kinase
LNLQIRERPHPNLLAIANDDIFESEIYRYVPLKYVRGGELFALLNKNGPFRADRARDIVSSVAKALMHLHEVIGYAHNDISLENILMEDDMRTPVVCDYGLAQKIGSKWDSNKHVSGKLPYQAPEIYSGTARVASPKADVFSLGVTMFVMLTGIPPFELPDPLHDMRYKYMQCGRMQELLKLWSLRISNEAVHLLTGMMFHNPDQRMTIGQVLDHAWFSTSSKTSTTTTTTTAKSSIRRVEEVVAISSSPNSVQFNFDDAYSQKKQMEMEVEDI